MRVLFLSAWRPFPADNGSKLRIYNLLLGLSQGHEVDLITFNPGPLAPEHEQHLRSICRSVCLVADTPFAGRQAGRLVGLFSPQPRSMVGNYSHAMAHHVRQHLATRTYDVVVASQLHMAPYARLARHVPLVLEELELAALYEQYAHASGLPKYRHMLTWWKTQRYVDRLLRRFAGVSVASERELELVSRHLPVFERLALQVIPNGVDVAGCAGVAARPEPDTLIYPGALSYAANFDAVAYFLGEIFPRIRQQRPSVRLKVTGAAQPEQVAKLPRHEGVEFTGYLDDVRAAVGQAWAEVVPLRQGGGTRLKVLEALALGTPVIATHKGIEGLGLRPEHDVLVADKPAEFAAQTLRLLGSPELRASLSANGRAAVARYDWSASVQRLERLLTQVAAPGVLTNFATTTLQAGERASK